MKVSLLRRHRHICEMRRLHAATFLSLPVGLSLGLETPSGCWASSIPPQLHLLGQFDPLGMRESGLWGKEDLAGSRPLLQCQELEELLAMENLGLPMVGWLGTWCGLWCCHPHTQGGFQLGFTQLMPSHGPERGPERGAAELRAGHLLSY